MTDNDIAAVAGFGTFIGFCLGFGIGLFLGTIGDSSADGVAEAAQVLKRERESAYDTCVGEAIPPFENRIACFQAVYGNKEQ